MKKITILALHLGYGGIERCITSLANSICMDYEVEIISVYKLYNKPSFYIHPNITIHYLIPNLNPNKAEFKQAIKKRNPFLIIKESMKSLKILYLRKTKMIKAIKELDSDIIISTRDIHNKLLSIYGSSTSIKIGWEHNHHNQNLKYIHNLIDSLKNLDYAVFVSSELASFYQEKLQNNHCKCIYIPNSIDYIASKPAPLTTQRLISVGRLSHEKGYEDLIHIMYELHKLYPSWKLDIVGDGEEYSHLVSLTTTLGLDNVVCFHGFQGREYINHLLADSSIYLMTSFTESFGIVLLEAFAYGIPCIAYDSAQGAKEVIDTNVNGFLIKNRNKDEFINKVIELMENHEYRKKLGNNAYHKVISFDSKEIKKQWLPLFDSKK